MNKEKSVRRFTIAGSDVGYSGGSYKTSGSPLHAAQKAARMLFRVVRLGASHVKNPKEHPAHAKYAKYASFEKQKKIKFLVRETTKGSNKESFYYEATIKALDKPVIVTRSGVEYKIETKVEVKSCKDPHNHHPTFDKRSS